MHFHTPSEHTLGGGYFSAEAHMVHQAWNGDVLVLGVFLEESADFIQHSNNTFFQQVWDAGGNQLLSGSAIFVNSSSPLNPYSTLLPSSRAQYVYSGSFTTPPCSEGVQWIVFQYPVMISNSDLSLLRRLTSIESGSPYSLYDGSNNRPTQPISSRTVYWSYGEEATNAIYSPYDLEDADDDMLVFTALAIGGTGLLVALVGLCLIFLVFWSNSYLLSSSSRNRIEKDLPMVSIINPVTDKSTFSTDEGAAHAPV